jgi:natural product precursor
LINLLKLITQLAKEFYNEQKITIMKKLQLNKEIIANLTSDNMNQVVGGGCCTCAECLITDPVRTADCEFVAKSVDKCIYLPPTVMCLVVPRQTDFCQII